MNKLVPVVTMSFILVCGCTSEDTANHNSPGLQGADKDEHGCIASAGYNWCERTNQCERPWELAEQSGFENTLENFEQYCAAEPGSE